MDFDQTCTEALLGGGLELIDFGDLDLISKVTSKKTVAISLSDAISCKLIDGF